ncbi:hypothetical protein NUH87_30930 [Pseudomonas batumici]|uniref:hypothetical protein n=1 Tax=Pseudomonas batumici TaxID=226910 RepID=UPI0030CEBC7C
MKRSIEFAGGGKRFAKYCADQSLKRCQEEYKTQFPETSDDEIAGFDSRCFNEPTLGLVENSKEEIAKAFGDEPIALSILGEELEHLAFTPSCLIPPKRSPRPAEPSQPLEGAADQSAQQPPAATVTPLLPIPPADDGTHPIHPKHTDPGPTPPSTLQLPADSEEVKGKNTVICSPSFTIVVNGLRATDLDVQESDDDNKSSSSYTKKKRRPKTTIKNQDFKLDNGAQGNSPEDINFKLSDNLPRAEADISVGKVEVSKDTLGTKIYAVHMFIGGEDARHSDDKASEIDRRKKESLEKVADWMRKSTFGAPASGARRVILSPGSAQSFYGVAPVLEHSDARNSIEATDVRAIQEIADIEPGGIGIANRVAFFNGAKEFRLNNKFLNDRHVELENIRPKAKYGEPVD